MQHEAGAVDRVAAFYHLAFVVGADQVRHLHLREMDRHRVGPVQLRMLRVAHRQVAGKAVVIAFQREGAACRHQPLLAVLAFLGERGELRDRREDQAALFGLVDGNAFRVVEHLRGAFEYCRHDCSLLGSKGKLRGGIVAPRRCVDKRWVFMKA
ncbi:hypothetical protein D3C72_1636100 [compost metagenome]